MHIVKMGALVVLAGLMGTGCVNYQVHTESRFETQNILVKVAGDQAINLQNGSVYTPGSEQVLGQWFGWTVRGDLHSFTESAVGMTKEVFERNNIKFSDKANKKLTLSVDQANCVQGAFVFCATVRLSVTTGNGVRKDFVGVQRYGNGYATTPAFEKAMGECVGNMMMDKGILSYLEEAK